VIHFIDGSVLFNTTMLGPVVVKISPFDENHWTTVFKSPGFGIWRVVLFSLAIYNLITAIIKESLFISRKRLEFNVAQITLLVQIVSHAVRSLVLFLDPIFSQQVIIFEIATFLNTITFPIEVITSLLIAFYWFGLIDDSHIGVYQFLGKLNIPFAISGTIILLQELAGGVIRVLNLGVGLQVIIIVNAILYLVIYVPAIIFFFVIGALVLQKTKELRDRLSKKLRRVTVRIMFSGVLLLLWLVPICLTVTDYLFLTPESYVTLWFFLQFFLLLSSLIQLSALQVPRKDNPDSKTSKSRSRTKEEPKSAPKKPTPQKIEDSDDDDDDEEDDS